MWHLFSGFAHGSVVAGRLLIHEGHTLPIPVLLLVLCAQVAESFQILLLSVEFCLQQRSRCASCIVYVMHAYSGIHVSEHMLALRTDAQLTQGMYLSNRFCLGI